MRSSRLKPKNVLSDFQRILIAVDGGPISVHAVEIGVHLACSLGTEVAFIHAIDPGLTYSPGLTPDQLIAEAERDAKAMIAGFKSLAPDLAALELIRIGKPAHEILAAAKEWPASVIVIGSHGRSGISRVLMGSVAEAVMRHAPCPALVVRAKMD